MKKKLNTSAIQNELSGQSVFFKQNPSSSSEKKLQKEPKPSLVRPVREVRDVRAVRGVRQSPKRERKRHPFDIYRDQLEKLKQMKMEHMMKTGETKSMSEMVRDALDTYIEGDHNRT